MRLQQLQKENSQLRRAVDELSILNELSAAIGASRSMEEMIHTIIKRSTKAVHAEQGVVTLVGEDATDPTKTLVRTMASSGDKEAFSPDQNLLGWMHLNRRPILINDPRTDDRFRGVRWPDNVNSIIAVPMIVQSQLIGILTLYNRKRGGQFSVEDQRLLSILAAQSGQLIENARLHEEEKKLLKMRQEVQLAYEIQMNLMPDKAPPVDHYDLAGLSIPAQSVGGDYFDYIPVDEGRLAICLGDVSGKGLPAALLMSNLQATLRGQAQFGPSVHETVEHANQLLTLSIRKGSFVTLFYGVLCPETHLFCYANAGHNRPYVRKPDGSVSTLDLGGLVLGFLATQNYREAELTMEPGDLLFIFSDGVTEAMSTSREQFGEERLEELLADVGDASSDDILKTILGAVRSHTEGAEQNDDITMVAVRRTD
jgi:phosphoserine phosphatase RsbU/P